MSATSKLKDPVEVDTNVCLYCGACVGLCPQTAMTLYETRIEIDDETCTRCGWCQTGCPVGAITCPGKGDDGLTTTATEIGGEAA